VQTKTQIVVQTKTQIVVQTKTQTAVQTKTQIVVQTKTQIAVQTKTQIVVQTKTQIAVQTNTGGRKTSNRQQEPLITMRHGLHCRHLHTQHTSSSYETRHLAIASRSCSTHVTVLSVKYNSENNTYDTNMTSLRCNWLHTLYMLYLVVCYGHSGSLNVTEIGTSQKLTCNFLLVFCCNCIMATFY